MVFTILGSGSSLAQPRVFIYANQQGNKHGKKNQQNLTVEQIVFIYIPTSIGVVDLQPGSRGLTVSIIYYSYM